MGYITYGAARCSLCHLMGANHQIRETQRSRFRAMLFIAEMSARAGDGAGQIIMHGSNNQKFMIGALIAGATTIVACSGNHDNFAPMITAAAHLGYAMAGYRAPPFATRGGGTVSLVEAGAAHAGGNAPQPGRCAAPKMILEAFSRNLHLNDAWRQWEMSEVFFQPSTSRRTTEINSNFPPIYDHGLSQRHCATCNTLVPMLMCGQRA